MQHYFTDPRLGENWFTYPNLYSRFVREFKSGSKFVEVGCWKGKSIAYLGVEIINSGKNIKVDAVDTWNGTPEEHDWDHYVQTNTLYELFLSNIEPIKDVINPIRLTSLEAAKLYDDNSLDVVFLDAAHDYESVKQDIAAWLPKIKTNGYIAGHDYYDNNPSCGVKEAVDDAFLEKTNLEITEFCWVYKKTKEN